MEGYDSGKRDPAAGRAVPRQEDVDEEAPRPSSLARASAIATAVAPLALPPSPRLAPLSSTRVRPCRRCLLYCITITIEAGWPFADYAAIIIFN